MNPRPMIRSLIATIFATMLVLGVAGCGDDDEPTTSGDSGTTTAAAGGDSGADDYARHRWRRLR